MEHCMEKSSKSAIFRHLQLTFPAQEDERVAFGPQAIDHALAGGLQTRRLHEIVPDGVFQLGAASGFALALASRAARPGTIVWIQQHLAALEGGIPYGMGGPPFGIAASRLLIVEAATAKAALWAMEESLHCSSVAAAIVELSGHGEIADLTITRRLNLATQEHGVFGLLLRQQALRGTSACATRWRVAAAPGSDDGFGGIGRTAFALTLEKNQHGPCDEWIVEWNTDDRCFRTALPVAVATPSYHRPYHAA